MAKMKDSVVTSAGAALVIESTAFKKIEFTKIALSSRKYAPEEIKNLTTLLDVRQTSLVNKVTTEGNTVIVESGFDNQELTQGYYIETIGVYGKVSGGKEVLFSVSIADEASYISKYNGITNSGVILSIATKLSNAENISLSVNPAAYATQGEVNQLTDELVEAQSDIDQIQTDIESGKVVTETKLVDYWTGEPLVLSGVANLVGKTAGSIVENPHIAFARADSTIQPPNGSWNEFSQNAYDKNKYLDNDSITSGNAYNTNRSQMKFEWDLIEQIDRDYPGLYESVGADGLAAKVAFVKKILASFEMAAYGFGSGPTGNKLTSVIWNGAAWVYAHTTTAGTITKLGYKLTDTRFLNDDGYMYNLVYAEPSDGTTASSVILDYAQLTYSLKLSLYDFVPAKKDIYDKTQADQRFVSVSENQTVGGVKNFLESPQVQGKKAYHEGNLLAGSGITLSDDGFNKKIVGEPYKVLFNGTISVDSGVVTLADSIENFSIIETVVSHSGCRVNGSNRLVSNSYPITLKRIVANLHDSAGYAYLAELTVDFLSNNTVRLANNRIMTLPNGSVADNSGDAVVNMIIGWY